MYQNHQNMPPGQPTTQAPPINPAAQGAYRHPNMIPRHPHASYMANPQQMRPHGPMGGPGMPHAPHGNPQMQRGPPMGFNPRMGMPPHGYRHPMAGGYQAGHFQPGMGQPPQQQQQMPGGGGHPRPPMNHPGAQMQPHPQQQNPNQPGGPVSQPMMRPKITPQGQPALGQPSHVRHPMQISQPTQNQNINNNNNQNIRESSHQASTKRKNMDRTLPDDVAILCPEAKNYYLLTDIEKKMDQTISWKRMEIHETLKRPLKTKRKLRVFITTQYNPGKRISAPDANGNANYGPGEWELRVEGRLIDRKGHDFQKKRKFSSFFQSLVIELDKEIYGPEQHLVEWHRNRDSNETDGFQVKRKGDKDVRCTMLFMMHFEPQKCKLEVNLARLLGLPMGTRAEVLYHLWSYIRNNKLQDPDEKDMLIMDPYLARIFRCDRLKFSDIPQKITQFLSKPDPIVIHQKIRCDPNEPKKTSMYDIDVEINDITNHNMKMFLNSTNNNEELNRLDNQVADIISALKTAKLRHEFFDEFALDPQNYIDKWLISQAQDMKTVRGEGTGKITDKQRKAGFYDQPWVDEAVNRYVFNKLNEQRLELEQAMYQKRVK